MKKIILITLSLIICALLTSCASAEENAIEAANRAMDRLNESHKINGIFCCGDGGYDEDDGEIWYKVEITYKYEMSPILRERYFEKAEKEIAKKLKPIFNSFDNYDVSIRAYGADGYYSDEETSYSSDYREF